MTPLPSSGFLPMMRIVAWNCNMALERKVEALLDLRPDIAVVSECARPELLRSRSSRDWLPADPIWIGRNPHKGLAVFAFNGYSARLADAYDPHLRYLAPVHVEGPTACTLLAAWVNSGGLRKYRLGPLRRALSRYRALLAATPAIIAGDLNHNVIWDKPGWRGNHATSVRLMGEMGLVSAYHAVRGEAHGQETTPTIYWRDRTQDGPTYHIDYVFLPQPWVSRIASLDVGAFDPWCAAGLSDHVPVVVDVHP
jgi:exodeoxyribonuclease-3